METLYVWLPIFGGATIALLATFLLASERELRNQRRELEKLRRNRNDNPQAPEELMTRNKELVEKISSLSSRLEESQRMVDELQTAQQRLVDAQSENQQLQQEIAILRNKLQTSESLLSTTASRYQESADRDSQLQSELAELREQMDKLIMKNKALREEIDSLSSKLADGERALENLETIEDRLHDTQSENQQWQAVNQEVQQEVANIERQLQASKTRLSEATSQNQAMAERNSRLQTEVVELNRHLEASQETIEELRTAQQPLGGVKFENQQLLQEIANLGNQLLASETRLSEAAGHNQEAADRYARLQTEVADLKRQVEEGEAKARDLEAARQRLGDFESREMSFTDQRHQLEAQIADLQRELSAGKEKFQALDASHKRVAEMEGACRELREENRRLEEEISRWQERLAESEESQRQVSALRYQLEELQTKHAAVQSSTKTAVGPTPESIESAVTRQERIPFGMAIAETNSPINSLGESSGNHGDRSADESASRVPAANEEEIEPAVRTSNKRKWRLVLIPAVAVLAMVVALDFLGTSWDRFSALKETAVAPETVSDEQWTPSEVASNTSRRPGPTPVSASGEIESGSKPAPRLRGAFKITRPTQVYSGPSESSSLIASVGPGMKITVVDSHDGWLEIRSKHGRPPGFIRQEAAVRIDQN